MYDCAPQADFDPAACRLTENRWIAGATADCTAAVTRALETYRFDEAASRLYQFVCGTFCDWYIELTNPILQREVGHPQEETGAVTASVLGRICRLLQPVIAF